MENKTSHIYQKTFFDLTPIESKGLNEVIFKNARQLKNDAIVLCKTNESYSSATSLLILSSEEVIKAILVLLHSEGYKVYEINDARKFFHDHKIRHQLSQLIEMFFGFFETVEKFENGDSKKLFNIKNQFWNSFLNGIFEIIRVAKPLLESTIRVIELEKFNDTKNNGFYVGYKDNLIIPEKKIGETEYIKTKKIVERIFKVYKILVVLYHPCICNREKQDDIEDIKRKIKEFIEKGMKDFFQKKHASTKKLEINI